METYEQNFSKHAPLEIVPKIRTVWLCDCGLVNKISRVTSGNIPIKSYEDNKAFKLYVLDVGLLGCMTGLQLKTILNSDAMFKEFNGSLTEQYVLQPLLCERDLNIYYYTNDNGRCETDFIVDNGENVVPVEVKAEINLKAKSLKMFTEKYSPKIAVRTSTADYKRNIVERSIVNSVNETKNKKYRLIIILATIAVVIIVSLLYYHYFSPTAREYRRAVALVDEGKFSEAYNIFADMVIENPLYKDTHSYMELCLVHMYHINAFKTLRGLKFKYMTKAQEEVFYAYYRECREEYKRSQDYLKHFEENENNIKVTPAPTKNPGVSYHSSDTDPYNAKDYDDADDFYFENADDFFDYEDAEDYYNENH